jgi:hypothetical protein
MSNWHAAKDERGHTEYHWNQDGGISAFVSKEGRQWTMSFQVAPNTPWFEADLGKTRSVDKALNRAELTIMSAQVDVHQNYEDMRTVLNLAKETEDRTPAEQGAIDRLQEAIDQGPPPGALDPAEDWVMDQDTPMIGCEAYELTEQETAELLEQDWLTTFDQEMDQRDKDRDQDQGRDA